MSLGKFSKASGINQIFDVTNKPLIFDGDTGGQIDHLDMKIKSMERLGISAVIFEDKTGLKQNSYFKIHLINFKKTKINLLKRFRFVKKQKEMMIL